jgi:putative transposase
MATFTQIYYHIVFSTKSRRPTLSVAHHEDLYKYIWGVIQKNDCHLYRINGMEDHIHISTSLHPTQCLSDFVKDIKLSTSQWIKDEGRFPVFEGWQEGYGAFTYAHKDKDNVIRYIQHQKEHHKKRSFREEFIQMLTQAGISFEERFLD